MTKGGGGRGEPPTAANGGGTDAARRATRPAASDVRSLDRAVAILDAFTPLRRSLTLSDVAQHVGLGTSTSHRLLRSLVAHGLLKRDEASKAYSLGPHVLRLARAAAGALDLRELARPVMIRLRDAAGETVGLHELRDANHRTVIDQVESHQPLRRTYTGLGEPIPLHQGAPGKALLAFQPAGARAALLERPLEAANERTIVDPDALHAELDDVRLRGFAVSYGERVGGIHTVAAPVFDHAGVAVASLSVTGPAMRMPAERLLELAPLVVAAAAELSAALGHRAPQETP
ncbi:MAG: IclR family transcriptional regulator [Trueperaceae bacterium]